MGWAPPTPAWGEREKGAFGEVCGEVMGCKGVCMRVKMCHRQWWWSVEGSIVDGVGCDVICENVMVIGDCRWQGKGWNIRT